MKIGREEIMAATQDLIENNESPVDYLERQGIVMEDLYSSAVSIMAEAHYHDIENDIKIGAGFLTGITMGIELGKRIEFEDRMFIPDLPDDHEES